MTLLPSVRPLRQYVTMRVVEGALIAMGMHLLLVTAFGMVVFLRASGTRVFSYYARFSNDPMQASLICTWSRS